MGQIPALIQMRVGKGIPDSVELNQMVFLHDVILSAQ